VGHGGADDEALAASQIDAERFAEVFDLRSAEMFSYFVRRLGSRSAAEELTAETFLRAFDTRHRFDPARGSARPWLYGIAANVLHLYQRAERRRRHAYSRASHLAPCGTASDGIETPVVTREVLRSALALLHPRLQDVVYLVAASGLTYEETAAALGVPVGTVRSRYSRARRSAQRLLRETTTDPWSAPSSDRTIPS
jgi:RNA polymerase sigma factor (sigma-70 family)